MVTERPPAPTLVLATTRLSASRLRALLPAVGISEWVALIPDYDVLTGLERRLRGIAARRRIAGDLRVAAETLRRPFLSLTATFGKTYDSTAWWAASVAERNTNGSDLFLHCCYLYLARRLLDGGGDLCIICDAPALRRSIADNARMRGYRVRGVGWPIPPLRETPVRPVAALAWKTASMMLRFLAVRLARRVPSRSGAGGGAVRGGGEAGPDVLLTTWVDRGSLDGSGLVHDRYLPGLAGFYASRGLSAATVLTILEDLSTFRDMIRRLRRSPDAILLEDHLRLSDLFFPFLLWRRQRAFHFEGAVLADLDVSRLFESAHRTEPLSVMASLRYPLMRRLALDGIHPRLIVLPFENMVADRLTILGARRFMPDAEVYGFCHNPLKRNVLAWYTDPHERDVAPLPHRVIANGSRYRDILIRATYPSERVVTGAALRYAYLHGAPPGVRSQGPAQFQTVPRQHERGPQPPGRSPRVLLVLTTKRDGTSEVIDKFVEALAGIDDAAIFVKPHPLARDFGREAVATLGRRAQIVDGTMAEALAQSDVVVCAASGAALESALAGKPVIRVSPESQLDMDPLAWFEEFDPPASTPGELRVQLTDALSRIGTPRPPRAFSDFFAPPTEVHMEAFLPSLGAGRGERVTTQGASESRV
jgi:hypothetical protein